MHKPPVSPYKRLFSNILFITSSLVCTNLLAQSSPIGENSCTVTPTAPGESPVCTCEPLPPTPTTPSLPLCDANGVPIGSGPSEGPTGPTEGPTSPTEGPTGPTEGPTGPTSPSEGPTSEPTGGSGTDDGPLGADNDAPPGANEDTPPAEEPSDASSSPPDEPDAQPPISSGGPDATPSAPDVPVADPTTPTTPTEETINSVEQSFTEDFSSNEISLTRFAEPELPLPNSSVTVEDEKLVLASRSTDSTPVIAMLSTRESDNMIPVMAETLAATIVANPIIESTDSVVKIYLGSNLYNDSFDENWNLLEGDVNAQVGLRYTGGIGWSAFCEFSRLDNDLGTERTVLSTFSFSDTPQPNIPYRVLIQQRANNIVCSFDGVEHTFAPGGNQFSPWSEVATMRISTVNNDAIATFDDLDFQFTTAESLLDLQSDNDSESASEDIPPPLEDDSSIPQASDETTPSTPDLIYAETYSSHTIEIFWGRSQNASGVVYELSRDGSVIATLDAISHVDDNLLPGQTYEYRLRAISNSGVRSTNTAIAIASTFPEPKHPDPPGSVNVQRIGPSTVEVSWTRTGNKIVENYIVEKNGNPIASGDFLSVIDDDSLSTEEFFYEVFAVDSDGNRSAGSGKIFLGRSN